MSHHEESTVVIVFGVGVVVCEVLACGSLLTSLLSALVFAVAEIPTIVACKWHCFPTLFGMEAPSSSEGSSMASVFLLKV